VRVAVRSLPFWLARANEIDARVVSPCTLFLVVVFSVGLDCWGLKERDREPWWVER